MYISREITVVNTPPDRRFGCEGMLGNFVTRKIHFPILEGNDSQSFLYSDVKGSHKKSMLKNLDVKWRMKWN